MDVERVDNRAMPARMPEVSCPDCGDMFAPELQEKPTRDGGARSWFTCPHCHSVYPVARISKKGIRIREQIARLPDGDPRLDELRDRMKRHVKPIMRGQP